MQIIPTVGVAPPLLKEKAGKICIDPIVEYAYRFDPLNYLGRIRCQTGVSLMKGLEYLQSQLHNIKIPLLVLHGDEDVLTYLSATQDLMRQVSSKDKTLEILRGEYHDFVHSPKYTEYFSIVSKWLNKRHFQK